MKKNTALLLFFTIIFYVRSFSQISLGSQTGSSVKLDQEINFNGATINLKNSTIETSNRILFLNSGTTVSFVNSKINCSNLDLTNVSNFSFSETIDINCDTVIFPTNKFIIRRWWSEF